MNATVRIFDALTIFVAVIAVGYAYLTANSRTGLEWAGTTALVLAAGLSLLIGGYLRFVARRISTLPEDYEEAEISDGAGELGFFSPHSPWPLSVAFGAAICTLGFVFGFWLLFIGIVVLGLAVIGMVFEYYRGEHAH